MRNVLNITISLIIIAVFGACGKEKKLENTITHRKTIKNDTVSVELVQVWATDTVALKTPECATYDPDQNVFYVSNLNRDNEVENDGYISIVNIDGRIKEAKWIEGLTSPLGNDIYNGFLFINDKTHILQVDIRNGNIVGKIHVEGASGLNGMDIDGNGNIYVADSGGNKIFKITQNKEILIVFAGDDLNKPNGVYLKDNDVLLIASSGGKSLLSLDLEKKQIQTLVEGIGQADGIIDLGGGQYITSSWTGEIYFITNNWEKKKILDTEAQKINAADIGYVPDQGILVVPTFYDNRLVAYKLMDNIKNRKTNG